jgi:hypothetical protein
MGRMLYTTNPQETCLLKLSMVKVCIGLTIGNRLAADLLLSQVSSHEFCFMSAANCPMMSQSSIKSNQIFFSSAAGHSQQIWIRSLV